MHKKELKAVMHDMLCALASAKTGSVARATILRFMGKAYRMGKKSGRSKKRT